MTYSGVHNICDLPPELLLQVTQHLSFKEHARWLLVDRRHRDCVSPILYLRLLPSTAGTSGSVGDATQITRKDVVRWAVEHGLVCTLKHVDEVEDMASFFGTGLTSSAAGLDLTPIHQAALYGHTSVIDYLLQKGADVNASTTNGLLPMHLAKTGEVVHLLAAHGGRLDHDATPSGVSALTSSISHQCAPSAVTAFLRFGVDPNHVAQDGTTAAEVAIVQGNVDALGILLHCGVDADKALPSGGFLLYKAIWLGARDHGAETARTMATMLLDRGASPNSGLDSALDAFYDSEPCHTPNLFLAVMMPSSADLVQLLLERGADQYMPYTRYRDPFYTAEKPIRGFEQAYDKSLVANLVAAMLDSGPRPPDPDGPRKLKLLIQYGGNIDTTIQDHTLLQYSLRQNGSRAQRGLDIIPLLIQLGADATRVDSEGNSTLHLLCGSFFHRVQQNTGYARSVWLTKLLRPSPLSSLIDVLVDRGADPNAKDAQGRTPLMLLCRHAHTVPTALLINVLIRHRSVDIKAVDKRGWNALHYATGEPADPFHDEPCFRLQVLLSRGNEAAALGVNDVNAYSESGRTPLHLLLEARDKPSGSRADEMQRRMMTKTRALAMLIRAGADVRARTRRSSDATTSSAAGVGGGETPLHLALLGHELEILLATRILLRHGATTDINYVSPSSGLTPLMMVIAAAGRGELSRNITEDMSRLLLTAGADAQMRDTGGRTAWDIFVELKGLPPPISPWALCLEGVAPGDLATGNSPGPKDRLTLSSLVI
ncbi:ankyrin repeat protein [Seiridium cupressi]